MDNGKIKTGPMPSAGHEAKMPTKENWVPLEGVSIGNNHTVKTDGVTIKGCKNTSRGKTARGPLA